MDTAAPALGAQCDVPWSDFPAADLPTKGELSGLKGCDAEAANYGIGQVVDYAKARKCALVQMRDLPSSSDPSEIFVGRNSLMMLYASGFGVKQNLKLALDLSSCAAASDAEHDASELSSRV